MVLRPTGDSVSPKATNQLTPSNWPQKSWRQLFHLCIPSHTGKLKAVLGFTATPRTEVQKYRGHSVAHPVDLFDCHNALPTCTAYLAIFFRVRETAELERSELRRRHDVEVCGTIGRGDL